MRIGLALMFFCNIAHSQNFAPSKFAILADSTGRAGNVREAIMAWQMDYSFQPNAETAYKLASLYAMCEYADSAFFWLQLALEKDSSDRAMVDGDFQFLTKFEKWEYLEGKQIAKLEAKQGLFKNLPLARSLWRVQMKDQAYTSQYSMARSKLGPDHPASLALIILNQKFREENAHEVEKLIQNFGWPKISEIGESAAKSVFYVIQHGSAEGRKRYLPELKAACQAKEAPWLWYATMYDRILNDQGKNQCYGTQFSWGAGGTILRKPIDAPEYINKRRLELGLEPITDIDVPQKD